jgi:hypothetical protein
MELSTFLHCTIVMSSTVTKRTVDRTAGARKTGARKAGACKTVDRVGVVATVLAGYAQRRVFQGFSRGPTSRGKTSFQIAWHRGRVFELTFEPRSDTLRLPELLTDIPAQSTMYEDLKGFIRARQAGDLPDHRRLDPRRVRIRTYNRGGNVLLVLSSLNGDCEYAVRKLVHLVNEIYLTFLAEGEYFDYLVETFDLDPDRM